MKYLIQDIEAYIHERKQWVSFTIEGQEITVDAEFETISNLVENMSILELELLKNSFCEPIDYYKKGEIMDNRIKASQENKFPKTWKFVLNGSLNDLRTKNESLLLPFETIYEVTVFKKENKQPKVKIRTNNDKLYFCQLYEFQEIVGVKENEFFLLCGSLISPVFYKKGEIAEDGTYHIKVKDDHTIIKDLNFRVSNTIDENYKNNGKQELYSPNVSKKRNSQTEEVDNNFLSYQKYNGYNDFDDNTIDNAFEGDPDATWNVD